MKSQDYFENSKFIESTKPKDKTKYQNISQGKVKKAKLISDIIKEEFADFNKSKSSFCFGVQTQFKTKQYSKPYLNKQPSKKIL